MSSNERDEAAQRRDLAARQRDAAAERRDREADARDEAATEGHSATADVETPREEAAHDRAQADREHSAEERVEAAHDREQAKSDRAGAASDRARAAKERKASATDELTGVLRRGAGLIAVQREIDRARRAKGRLVAAFVDVDGLKAINDAKGHAAGDALLVAVAHTLQGSLRSYDVVCRVGGDEFVCVLSDVTLEVVRRLFDEAHEALAARVGASISVGFAELQPDESADDLIRRADHDLLRSRSGRPASPADTPRFSRETSEHPETTDPAASS